MSHNLNTITDKTVNGAKVLCLISANFVSFWWNLALSLLPHIHILDTNIKLNSRSDNLVSLHTGGDTALEITGENFI